MLALMRFGSAKGGSSLKNEGVSVLSSSHVHGDYSLFGVSFCALPLFYLPSLVLSEATAASTFFMIYPGPFAIVVADCSLCHANDCPCHVLLIDLLVRWDGLESCV